MSAQAFSRWQAAPTSYPQNRPPPPKRSSWSVLEQKAVNIHGNGTTWSRSRDGVTQANFNPPLTKHQRTRSASAVVYRPLYDANFLRPVPPPPPHRLSTMGSVVGPSHAPHYTGFPPAFRDASTRDFIVRPDQPRMFGDSDEPDTHSLRMVSMVMGPSAQSDSRQARPTSSSSNGSTALTRDSFDARMRSPASSRTSFESWDSAPRKVEYGWQRPALIKQHRKRPSGEIFGILPGEVIELILDELRRSHMAPGSSSCATCLMRDLCSVAISARKFLKYARFTLYEDIQLVGSDSPAMKKRYKINNGARMVLLRRTLRSNPQIAGIVHKLKVPAAPPGTPLQEYQNLIASIIMACPNFERLDGPYQTYDHNFSRLFHALSTRDRLKEMNWLVEASPFQRQRRMQSTSDLANGLGQGNMKYQEAPGDLQPYQSRDFWELNKNWTHLKSLSIHCMPGATLTPLSMMEAILDRMPALQNLHLSHLPSTSFNDTNLVSLPPLKHLRLSHLPGVTSAGLSSFATRPSSRSIKSLTLQHLNLDSLPALARILSNLTSLNTFSLVQAITPVLPEGEMIWLYPYLASASVQKLHWDITSHPTCANMADSILAKSIAANGFPSVRTLRAPNDPEGIFQALCKPVEKVELPNDRYKGRGMTNSATGARPGTPGTPKTPMTPKGGFELKEMSFPGLDVVAESSDLHLSRMAAQTRLEAARRFPRYFVNVIDDDGTVLEKYGLAGFLGQVESPIHYSLIPDPGATDENGGLVEVSDMLGEGGEDISGTNQSCTGRWNSFYSIEKKEQMRWRHEERGRWRGVSLF